ncbi:MAG: hypothetical protein WC369_07430 [Dehalococcoidales bacterium]
MAEQADELKKLAAIAADLGLVAELRTKSIELIGRIGSPEALHTLLDLAGREDLFAEERELCLKYAKDIIKQRR